MGDYAFMTTVHVLLGLFFALLAAALGAPFVAGVAIGYALLSVIQFLEWWLFNKNSLH